MKYVYLNNKIVVKIFIYLFHRFEEIIVQKEKCSVEEILIYLAKKCKISPVTIQCFGLRKIENYKSSKCFVKKEQKIYSWLKDSDILENDCQYEFRMRFFVQFDRLKDIDYNTYYYCFKQIWWDLIQENVEDTRYPNHKDEVLGLCASIIRLEMLSQHYAPLKFKKYIPKSIRKNHFFAYNRELKCALKQLSKSADKKEIIRNVLNQFYNLSPNYMIEEYKARLDNKNIIEKVKVNLKDDLRSGLFSYNGIMWDQIGSLKQIESIVSRSNSIFIKWESKETTINFLSETEMEQFLSSLLGYYRLSIDWMETKCQYYGNVHVSRTLKNLKRLDCHGPIGEHFSYQLLQKYANQNQCAYLLRQSDVYFNKYILDVCLDGVIQTNRAEMKLLKGELWKTNSSTSPQTLPDFLETIFGDYEDLYSIPKKIFPHMSSKCSSLLLCSENKTPSIGVELAENTSYCKTLVAPVGETILIKLDKTKPRKAKSSILLGYWEEKGNIKIRLCSNKSYQEDFKKLTSQWNKLDSNLLLKGLCLSNEKPCANILEFAAHGKLNKFLLKENVPFRFLIKIAIRLTRALKYLEEQFLFHPYIRGSNIFVTKYENKNYDSFETKLGDPGIPEPYNESDWPYIPRKYLEDLESAKTDPKTVYWAFSTTIWEIFHRGRPITEKSLRDAPDGLLLSVGNIPEEIISILRDGWSNEYSFHTKFSYDKILSTLKKLEERQNLSKFEDSTIFKENINIVEKFKKSVLLKQAKKNGGYIQTKTLPNIENWSWGWCQKKIKCKWNDKQLFVNAERIDEGNFGVVLKGKIKYNGSNDERDVAVKYIKNFSINDVQNFRIEMDIMKNLNHKNVIKIITTLDDPLMIVMEYIPNNLKSLMKSREFSNKELLKIALDIAVGMKYLQLMKVIHRDLAARNILINIDSRGNYYPIISDFGLARTFAAGKLYYTITNNTELPIRWYALESLETLKFSLKSDVWSFGVLLYEIFSRLQEPYGGNVDLDYLKRYLRNGNRLNKPEMLANAVYLELMRPCWDSNPESRPGFEEIELTITKFLN